MCRIAGYLGPPISADRLLHAPPHGLVDQSRNAREMHGSTIAGDGWGIGWFTPSGSEPGMLKSILPLWSDENAKTATRAILTGSLVAHARYASPGIEVCLTNTPLYPLGDAVWTVNGEMSPWPGPLSKAMRDALDPEEEAAIRGNTDAEMLGGLWRTHLKRLRPTDPGAALRAALAQARDLVHEHDGTFSVNVLIGFHSRLIACRYAATGEPNSLYYLTGQSRWQGAALIASEPMDDGPGWEAVAPSTLVEADETGVRCEPLSLPSAPGSKGKRRSA